MGRRQFKYYSQNETDNARLLANLIDRTSIIKGDVVYDIGAGAGNITSALLDKGARVIAVEKDIHLYRKCCQRFRDREAAAIHHADFLQWEFSPGHRYKVFANIPFMQTAEIVRKLLLNKSPPEDCYLIMQKEAALKYAGIPKETLFSLLIKPVFWVDIIYYFKRKDFFPSPAVDIVLIQFEKRHCRLIPENLDELYRDFIVYCREGAQRSIEKTLQQFLPDSRIKQIAALSGLDLHARPVELGFCQYLCVFQCILGDNLKNLTVFHGAEARFREKRSILKKRH